MGGRKGARKKMWERAREKLGNGGGGLITTAKCRHVVTNVNYILSSSLHVSSHHLALKVEKKRFLKEKRTMKILIK